MNDNFPYIHFNKDGTGFIKLKKVMADGTEIEIVQQFTKEEIERILENAKKNGLTLR